MSQIAYIRRYPGGRGFGGQPEADCTFQQDCLEQLCMSPKVLVIDPDKLRGPTSCLTNTGVNIRSMPPI